MSQSQSQEAMMASQGEVESRPATRRASWKWILALFTAASFIETIFWGQMGAFTPLYLPQLGVAVGKVVFWTGVVTAVSSAAGLPFLPFWGALADRYARQPVIVRSFAAHTLAALLGMVAGSVWVFVAARGLMSLALGNSGLMMTTLSERVPARRVGFAFSVMNSAAPIGVFVGPLIGGPVVDHFGFRTLLGLDGALLLLVTLGMSLGYRDNFRPAPATKSLVAMAGDSVRAVVNSPRLRALFPALFVSFAGWMLAMAYVPLAVTALYHGRQPGTAVGVTLGIGGLVAMVTGPLMGALADRYGQWRTLLIGAAIEVALWPLPALTHSLPLFIATWSLLSGVTSGAFALSFTVLSSSTSNSARGRVMAMAYLPVNLGGLAGPAIGGLITGLSVFAIFPLGAVLTGLGLVMLALARRQPRLLDAPADASELPEITAAVGER